MVLCETILLVNTPFRLRIAKRNKLTTHTNPFRKRVLSPLFSAVYASAVSPFVGLYLSAPDLVLPISGFSKYHKLMLHLPWGSYLGHHHNGSRGVAAVAGVVGVRLGLYTGSLKATAPQVPVVSKVLCTNP